MERFWMHYVLGISACTKKVLSTSPCTAKVLTQYFTMYCEGTRSVLHHVL